MYQEWPQNYFPSFLCKWSCHLQKKRSDVQGKHHLLKLHKMDMQKLLRAFNLPFQISKLEVRRTKQQKKLSRIYKLWPIQKWNFKCSETASLHTQKCIFQPRLVVAFKSWVQRRIRSASNKKREDCFERNTYLNPYFVLSYSIQPVEKEGHSCCSKYSYLKLIFLTCNKYNFISACSLTNLICIAKIEENLKTKQECWCVSFVKLHFSLW